MFKSKKATPQLLDKDQACLTDNPKSPFYRFAHKNQMVAKMIVDTRNAISNQKGEQSINNNRSLNTKNSKQQASGLIQIQAEHCEPVPIYLLTNPSTTIDEIVKKSLCFENDSCDLYVIQRVSERETISNAPRINNAKNSPEFENVTEATAPSPSMFPSVKSHPALAKQSIEWEELDNSNALVHSDNLIFSKKKTTILLPTLSGHTQKTKQVYLIQIKRPLHTAIESDEKVCNLIDDLRQIREKGNELLFMPDNLSTLFEKAFIVLSNLSLLKRKEMVLFESFVFKDIDLGVKDRFNRDLVIYKPTNESNDYKKLNPTKIYPTPERKLIRFFNQDTIASAMQLLRVITLNQYLHDFHKTLYELTPYLTCKEKDFKNDKIQADISTNYHEYFWRELNMLRLANSKLNLIDKEKFYTKFFGYTKIDYSKQENQNILAEFLSKVTDVHEFSLTFATDLNSSKIALVENSIFIKTMLSCMKNINGLFNEIGFYPAKNSNTVINNNNNQSTTMLTPNPGTTQYSQFGNKMAGKRKDNPNNESTNNVINKRVKKEEENSPRV